MNERAGEPNQKHTIQVYLQEARKYEQKGEEASALSCYQRALSECYRDPSPDMRSLEELERKVMDLRGASWGI